MIVLAIISIIIDLGLLSSFLKAFFSGDPYGYDTSVFFFFWFFFWIVITLIDYAVLHKEQKKNPESQGFAISFLKFQTFIITAAKWIALAVLAAFGITIADRVSKNIQRQDQLNIMTSNLPTEEKIRIMQQKGYMQGGQSQPQQPAPQPEEPYDRVIANPRQTRKCALCRNFNGGRGSSSIKFTNRRLCEFNGKEVGSCPYVGKTTAGTNAPCRGYFSSKYEDL